MRRLILLLLLLGAAKPPAAPLSAERVVTGDGVTAMTVNGEPVRVLADPAAPGLPLLTQAVADRLGLKLSGKLGIGFVYSVGPTRVSAATKVARTALGGKPEKQRVAWTGRRFSGEVDGTVGPAGLPDAVVRFVLRDARPGERTFALPIEEIGFPASLFGGGWSATYALLDVGGKPMRVRFDPRHPRSLATATAATRIARIGGGALSGEAVATEISFGIERPVRPMRLARPLPVGGLSLSSVGVRVADAGTVTAIPEAGAAPPDPAEVVVTGKGKKRDWRQDVLSLGADVLGRCSAIVFDKPAKQVRLSCPGS